MTAKDDSAVSQGDWIKIDEPEGDGYIQLKVLGLFPTGIEAEYQPTGEVRRVDYHDVLEVEG